MQTGFTDIRKGNETGRAPQHWHLKHILSGGPLQPRTVPGDRQNGSLFVVLSELLADWMTTVVLS